ncbi:hypothetical protein C8F01DRAFT_1245270 [Mycena amicta]|nr:hypothetical protein C8F01DRAFT_1245270 [Mycena amicta]
MHHQLISSSRQRDAIAKSTSNSPAKEDKSEASDHDRRPIEYKLEHRYMPREETVMETDI